MITRGSRDGSKFSRPVELVLYATPLLSTMATAPMLAQGLGPEDRGRYGLALAVATLALTLGSWGQGDLFLGRTGSGAGSDLRAHSRVAMAGGLLAGLICLAVLRGLGLTWPLAAAASLSAPALALTTLWQATAVWAGRLRPLAVGNVVVAGLRVAALACLLVLGVLTASVAVVVFQGALLVGIMATAWWYTRDAARSLRSGPGYKALLAGGAALSAFHLLNALLQRADLVVLQLRSTELELGLYAAPASLTTAALALSAAYKPSIQAKLLDGSAIRALRREFLQVLTLGVAGVTGLWFLAPLLVKLLFGAEFAGSVLPLRLLGLATLPLLALDLTFAALIARGRRTALIGITASGAVVNVVAGWWLTASLGAEGAALALFAAYLTAATVGGVLLIRPFPSKSV